MTLPFDEQRDLLCDQAIQRLLRLAPDVCTWTDYSASTPTIYFGQGAQIAVPAKIESDDVVVRNDLVVPGVTVQVERIGTFKVMTLGALLMMLGLLLAPLSTTTWALTLTLGVLVSAGAGAGSFAIMIAAASRALPPERRAFAAGFINAGGSFGQFLFAPIAQLLISGMGWMMALITFAVTAACTSPLAFRFVQRATPTDTPTLNDKSRAPITDALRNPNYLYLHAGFFTCGLCHCWIF